MMMDDEIETNMFLCHLHGITLDECFTFLLQCAGNYCHLSYRNGVRRYHGSGAHTQDLNSPEHSQHSMLQPRL